MTVPFNRVVKIRTGDSIRYVYDNKGHLLFERSSGSYSQRSYAWLDDIPLAVIDQKTSREVLGVYLIETDFANTPAICAACPATPASPSGNGRSPLTATCRPMKTPTATAQKSPSTCVSPASISMPNPACTIAIPVTLRRAPGGICSPI